MCVFKCVRLNVCMLVLGTYVFVYVCVCVCLCMFVRSCVRVCFKCVCYASISEVCVINSNWKDHGYNINGNGCAKYKCVCQFVELRQSFE